MEKRRAKRIVDRKVKNEDSEEEKPLLTLIARIIAEIAIVEMDRDEDIKDGHSPLNKPSPSLIKTETKKYDLSGSVGIFSITSKSIVYII